MSNIERRIERLERETGQPAHCVCKANAIRVVYQDGAGPPPAAAICERCGLPRVEIRVLYDDREEGDGE